MTYSGTPIPLMRDVLSAGTITGGNLIVFSSTIRILQINMALSPALPENPSDLSAGIQEIVRHMLKSDTMESGQRIKEWDSERGNSWKPFAESKNMLI